MFKMPAGPNSYFDVDDTIICWNKPENATDEDMITIACRGLEHTFYVNKHNVDFLKKLAVRGHAIVVWSAGGVDWSEAVIKALKLEEYVWAVASKPTYYVDDMADPKGWIGKHRFYDFDGNKHYVYETIVQKENK